MSCVLDLHSTTQVLSKVACDSSTQKLGNVNWPENTRAGENPFGFFLELVFPQSLSRNDVLETEQESLCYVFDWGFMLICVRSR
jgi:hypothetical protein